MKKKTSSNQKIRTVYKILWKERKQDANQMEVQAEMELETYEMEMEIDWLVGGERKWKR